MQILRDEALLQFRGKQESQQILPVSNYLEDALEDLQRGPSMDGDPLPWITTHPKFRLRPGEVTVWAGPNYSGKSLVTGMVAVWLMRHTKVLMASLEMKPSKTIGRMLQQASAGPRPGDIFIEDWRAKAENMWIYDQTDSVEPERMLSVCAYAAQELGCKHLFIDSLMKCIKGEDDYNGQKDFVNALTWIAKKYDVHVHLIHHARKSQHETDIVDKYSIKGTGAIIDLVDNAVLVQLNGIKAKMQRENNPKFEPEAPDCYMRVAKQRHGDWDGLFAFWWHRDSQQWISRQGAGPLPW